MTKVKQFMNKKKLIFILLAAFYLCLLTGCATNNTVFAEDVRFHIVCTTFPQYDWVVNLIQGNEEAVSVTLLMDKGDRKSVV